MIEKLPHWFCIFSLGLFHIFLWGCTTPPPQNCYPTSSDLAVGQNDPINRIELYLENSASMGGYFRFKTRFNDHLDDLVTDLMQYKGDSLQVFTIAEEIEVYPNAKVFRDELNPTNPKKIAIAKSSPLDSILHKIASKWEPGVLSILVTDGIISGTTKQIEANREYNKDNRNALKNNFKIILGLFPDDLALKIIAFKSEFQATSRTAYFKYDNSKVVDQVFVNRPYYLIVMGSSGQIREIERELAGSFYSQYSLEFGFKDPVKSRTTSVSKDRQGVTLNGECVQLDSKSNKYAFAIIADFDVVPDPYKSLEYLRDNAKIVINGQQYPNFSVHVCHIHKGGCDDFIYEPSARRTVEELSDFTHLFQIQIDDYRYKSGDILELIVDKKQEPWYDSWSSDSDHDIHATDSTTFAFSSLIQGIRESYNNVSPILLHEIRIFQP